MLYEKSFKMGKFATMKKFLTLLFLLISLDAFAGRMYSPEYGRWVNRDPIGAEGGINLYNSVSNNMVNGFSGGYSYSNGMSLDTGLLVENFGVDPFGYVTLTQVAKIAHELDLQQEVIRDGKKFVLVNEILKRARMANFNNLNEDILIDLQFTSLIKEIQRKLGVVADGDFGPGTVDAYEKWAKLNNGKVKLRDSQTSLSVLLKIMKHWPAGHECVKKCPIGIGEFLTLIHYESMDVSTKTNGRPTYFNAVGGPAGTKNLRTTAVGLGQFTIATAPDGGLTFEERYDPDKSIKGALKLLFDDAAKKDCKFMEKNRGLNRWEAWRTNRQQILNKGKKINQLIDDHNKGNKRLTEGAIDSILGI